jgi:hypothetical protein
VIVIAVLDDTAWPCVEVARGSPGPFTASIPLSTLSLGAATYDLCFYAITAAGTFADSRAVRGLTVYYDGTVTVPGGSEMPSFTSVPASVAGSNSFLVNYMGYTIELRSSSSLYWRPQVTNIGSVSILAIEVQSATGSDATFDVGFYGGFYVGGSGSPSISPIDGGFSATGGTNTVYFLRASHALAVPTSTYWLGSSPDAGGNL